MVFKVNTDCCCTVCGRRHIGIVDLDKLPPKVFGYYQIICIRCENLTQKQRDAMVKAQCEKYKKAPKGRVRYRRK